MPAANISRRALLSIAAAALAAAVTGCGSGGPPTPTIVPTPTPTPLDILAQASTRLAETQSVAFTLDVQGNTFLDPQQTIRLLSAQGVLKRPDRVQTTFKAEVLGRAVTLQLITVGDKTWLTNILTGEWGPAPEEFTYRPSVLFDTQEGIGPVMGRVQDVQRLDDEELDGRPAYHIRAKVDESVIGPLTYYTIHGSPVTVDLWIDRETNDLLRARLSEPPAADRPNPAVWTLNLSKHGEDVDIEPPV
ncbi:MAG: LppX_LprAFG lipoprotein [Thermomicrobiales bacterium]|nr:LppX_LprAFG lipoprotein [Thermomicrobiales bacterium]